MRLLTPQHYLDAVIRNDGNRGAAAKELGVTTRAVFKNLKTCLELGLEVPESPYNTDRAKFMIEQAEAAHHAAPASFSVKGVSTLYSAEGEVKQQWVKTNQSDE